MDFSFLFSRPSSLNALDFNTTAANGSVIDIQDIIALLGNHNPVVQLFMLLYRILPSQTRITSATILTAVVIIWILNKIWRQVSHIICGLMTKHFSSSVSISSHDVMYPRMMHWLALQPGLINSRFLALETTFTPNWQPGNEPQILSTITLPNMQGRYLNFSAQKARTMPKFMPALGAHGFRLERRYFWLYREQESFLGDNGIDSQTFKDKEKLIISCLGRSAEPIKNLILRAQKAHDDSLINKTIIKRPSPPATRQSGGPQAWSLVATRHTRPMHTVVLSKQKKVQVLDDMNEYLHPGTSNWYSDRGIPLRRGYLFHGPPGTGKTSLAFVLAGVFGLEVYVISLVEPSLTDEDLLALFNSLPYKCIILLEDIDTAGLTRSSDNQDDDDNLDIENGERSNVKVRKPKGNGSGLRGRGRLDDEKGISLSGLLNAIDGVASHEGRVLIMTTNRPEVLDEALVRPGRVDMKVEFTYATKEQAGELFQRMYEVDSKGSFTVPKNTDHHNKPVLGGAPGNSIGQKGENLTTSEMEMAATNFAAKIPAGFTIAELQGFLMDRKNDPRRALKEVDTWVDGMLSQKASSKKVIQVQ